MKINSLLIANRGEIAIRICRTAKALGIKTYGITHIIRGKIIVDIYPEIFFGQIPDVPETGNYPEILSKEFFYSFSFSR